MGNARITDDVVILQMDDGKQCYVNCKRIGKWCVHPIVNDMLPKGRKRKKLYEFSDKFTVSEFESGKHTHTWFHHESDAIAFAQLCGNCKSISEVEDLCLNWEPFNEKD